MDCYWRRRPGGIIYQRASSRLFIPRGDDVFTVAAYEFKWEGGVSRACFGQSQNGQLPAVKTR